MQNLIIHLKRIIVFHTQILIAVQGKHDARHCRNHTYLHTENIYIPDAVFLTIARRQLTGSENIAIAINSKVSRELAHTGHDSSWTTTL